MQGNIITVSLPVGLSDFGGIIGSRLVVTGESLATVQIAYYEKKAALVRFIEQNVKTGAGLSEGTANLRLRNLKDGPEGINTLAELEIVYGQEKQRAGKKEKGQG